MNHEMDQAAGEWTAIGSPYWTPELIHQTNETTYVFIENPRDMVDPFHSNQNFMAIVLTHAITFVVGVIGNSVVIATWARGGKIRSPTATFLVSLACADLLLLIIFMPLETLEYFVITWDYNGHICKLSSFVELLSGMSSILNLVALSVERFLVIVYPIHARRWCTVKKSRRSLIFVWLLAIILAAPPVFNKSTYSMTYYNNETVITAYYCFEKNDNWALYFSIYELLILFVIPATLMLFCYFRVIRELWKSTRVITILTSASGGSSRAATVTGSKSYPSNKSDHTGLSGATRGYIVRWSNNKTANSEISNTSVNVSSSSGSRSQRWQNENSADNYNQASSPSEPATNQSLAASPIQNISSSSFGLFSYFCAPKFGWNCFDGKQTIPKHSPPMEMKCVRGYNHQNHHRCHSSALKSNANGSDQTLCKQHQKSYGFTKNCQCSRCNKIDLESTSDLDKSCTDIDPKSVSDCKDPSNLNESINRHLKILKQLNFSNNCNQSNDYESRFRSSKGNNESCSGLNNEGSCPVQPKLQTSLNCLSTPVPSTSTQVATLDYKLPSVRDVGHARRQLYCQVIKMLLFIVILFHFCWGPRLIFNVIKSTGLGQFDKYAYSARVYFYLLSFIHSALNPFVYGFMSSNFRRMMMNSCKHHHHYHHHHHRPCDRNRDVTTPINHSIAEAMAITSCVNMGIGQKALSSPENSDYESKHRHTSLSNSFCEQVSPMEQCVLSTNNHLSISSAECSIPEADLDQVENEINQMVDAIKNRPLCTSSKHHNCLRKLLNKQNAATGNVHLNRTISLLSLKRLKKSEYNDFTNSQRKLTAKETKLTKKIKNSSNSLVSYCKHHSAHSEHYF